jgi:DNA-binding transcriptional regulator YiaG
MPMTLEKMIEQTVERAVARALRGLKTAAVAAPEQPARRGRKPGRPAGAKNRIKPAVAKAAAKTSAEKQEKIWFFSKGIRSLRKRLRVSQAELGKLAGVTSQAVALWERRNGRLKLRTSTTAKLQEIRAMGARAVQKALADLGYVKGRRGRKPGVTAPVVESKPVKKAGRKKIAAKKVAAKKVAVKKRAVMKAIPVPNAPVAVALAGTPAVAPGAPKRRGRKPGRKAKANA